MADNLEDMLARAKEAQQAAGETHKRGQTEQAAVDKDNLRSKLQEREVRLGAGASARGERTRAEELMRQAEAAIADSEGKITPEMTSFLRAAAEAAEARRLEEEEAVALAEQIDKDPAVYAALQEQAIQTNEGKALNAKYYDLQYGINTKLTDRNSPHGRDYYENIGGNHSLDDPNALLTMYGSMSTGEWYDKRAPLSETKGTVERMARINEEAGKASPDMKKIDAEYAEFLFKRLEHFASTLDQRLAKSAQSLFDYYQKRPDDAKKYGVSQRSVEDWERSLRSSLPPSQTFLNTARLIMSRKDGFKARDLAKLGYEWSRKAHISSDMEHNPFVVDEFEEK